jgi:acetyl esterase/lipase
MKKPAMRWLALLAFLPVSTAWADDPPIPTPRPDITAFAGGVTASYDLVYATPKGAEPQTLDLYIPRAKTQPLPIVMFIHGGSWKNGNSRLSLSSNDFPRALAGLAAQGYVVASINYRLSPGAHFPAALQDVKSAISWLRQHASEHGGDPTRLAVWGASAGGQLAAMAGAACGVMAYEPEEKPASGAPGDCAEAVIDWFGPVDLAAATGQDVKDIVNYLGCPPEGCAPALLRRASPLAFISPSTPPFLIQQGAADSEVLPSDSKKLYDALKASNVPVAYELYPDVGHGFRKNNAPDEATVAKAMARMTQFLAATFPPPPKAKPAPKRRR